MGETIRIEALDGEGGFDAWLARPEGSPRAAIIVIQEIFGVNDTIRALTEAWAAKGYLAAAPDLFWRFAPAFRADPDIPEQKAQAFEIRTRFDIDKGIADIEAVIRALRALLPDDGKVGAVGYCMGGRVAFLTAARTDIDATVGYYATQIDPLLRESHGIARPLMLHFGAEDDFIPAETREAIGAALADRPRVAIHTYAGAGHGFAVSWGARRNEAAATAADARTDAFFAEHLA